MRRLAPAEVHAARAHRQRLAPSQQGRDDEDYLQIVRALGPLRPPSHAYPGTPVLLHDRFNGDVIATAERVRREGWVFKGRFNSGLVAYVATDEVGLYRAAFARPLRAGEDTERIIGVLGSEGPLHRSTAAT